MSTPTYDPPNYGPPSPAPEPSTDSQPAENEEKKASGPRPYYVFEQIEEDVFKRVATVEATSQENAVKSLGVGVVGRKFGACPVRNWKDVAPKLRPESVTF